MFARARKMEVESLQSSLVTQQQIIQETYEPTPAELIRDLIIGLNFEEESKQDEVQMFEL